MKVLVVSPNHTHPVTNGTARFINEYCDMIRGMGHDVYFLHVTYIKKTEADRERVRNEIECSSKAWGDHYFHFSPNTMSDLKNKVTRIYRQLFCDCTAGCDDNYPGGLGPFVKKLNNEYRFDAVIVNYYWLSKLFKDCDIPRQALVAHDSYSNYNIRNGTRMWFNLSPSEESKALQRCHTIFAMQNDEAALFRYLSPKSRVLVSFCNYSLRIQKPVHNHNLLFFSGGLVMNKPGFEWFMLDVFPLIKADFPDSKVIVGGSFCKTVPEYADNPDVEMVGYVDDPADFFSRGDIAINPTYLGAGLKIKTFEAMSYGKTVMVHPHCTVGIFHKETAPIFSSADPNDWVNFLHKVWDEPNALNQRTKATEEYMTQMNEYIYNQFASFLK